MLPLQVIGQLLATAPEKMGMPKAILVAKIPFGVAGPKVPRQIVGSRNMAKLPLGEMTS